MLHVRTFSVRSVSFLEFLIKQLGERLHVSTGDQSVVLLEPTEVLEGSKVPDFRRTTSVLRQEMLMRLATLAAHILMGTSAVTFTDELDCKLVVPFTFFPWTVDPVFRKLAFQS